MSFFKLSYQCTIIEPAAAGGADAATASVAAEGGSAKAAKPAKQAAAKAPDRAVDFSRLDMRVGRILTATMVSIFGVEADCISSLSPKGYVVSCRFHTRFNCLSVSL